MVWRLELVQAEMMENDMAEMTAFCKVERMDALWEICLDLLVVAQ